jgi:magnesium-transporting ATPase (P-type)
LVTNPLCLSLSVSLSVSLSTSLSACLILFFFSLDRAGIVGFAAFDKTGTLTEERLHFKGVAIPQHLSDITSDPISLFSEAARGTSRGSVELNSESSQIPSPCTELMATCHALAVIDGATVGDPLEVEMFRASGFSITNPAAGEQNIIMSIYSPGPPIPTHRYDVLRHFEFTSDRARAGSLVRRPNHDVVYYTKGSPEAILKLVDPTTIPSDIHSTLTTLSKRGLRVLAMAYKPLTKNPSADLSTLTTLSQVELEHSSIFLGLIFLSNALKAETLSTINSLRNANIKCNMITGDHIHTAIAIATDCGLLVDHQEVFIIDAANDTTSGLTVTVASTGDFVTNNVLDFINNKSHGAQSPLHPSPNAPLGPGNDRSQAHLHTQIAITGQGLEVVKSRHSFMMKLVLESTQVFARMKPSDKQFIVEQLQHLTESDVKEMFVDEESISTSTDMVQISCDLPAAHSSKNMRKSILDDVAMLMNEDGKGALHVIFCGDGAIFFDSALCLCLSPCLSSRCK